MVNVNQRRKGEMKMNKIVSLFMLYMSGLINVLIIYMAIDSMPLAPLLLPLSVGLVIMFMGFVGSYWND